MNKIRKNIFISLVVCLVFGISGCSKEVSNEAQAKAFLEDVLTIPNDDLVQLAKEFKKVEEEHIELDKVNEKMMNGIKTLCDGFVSSDILERANSTLLYNIMMYQTLYYIDDYEIKVSNIVFDSSSDGKSFGYVATIKIRSNVRTVTKDTFEISGNIQFDDNHKITFLTIPFDKFSIEPLVPQE